MTFRTSRRSLAVLAATASLRSDTPPLIAAAKAGDTARVAALLKSEPAPDAGDADGNTALHWAAVQGHDAVVRDLLRGGASVRATNAFGATPLIYAAGSLDSVRALLDAHAAGQTQPVAVHRVGPDLVFGRLWKELRRLPERGTTPQACRGSRGHRGPVAGTTANRR